MAMAMAVACGDDDGSPSDAAPGVAPAAVGGPAASSLVEGDALLARARASIRDGRVDAELVRDIRGSSDPAHARAARLFAAIAGELPPADESPEPDGAPLQSPGLVPPGAGGDDPPPVPEEGEPDAEAGPKVRQVGDDDGSDVPSPPATRSRREVSALSLSSNDRGATLTIKAPGGVTVGVANQPASGIVRLVIEGASASPKVTGARPKITGARVTGVRKGQDTVQITLQLDPGWRLDGVKSFSGGARVVLLGPAGP